MVQFRILSGQRSGQTIKVEQFPWTIGRSATAHLQLAEEGIWDDHLELHLHETEGFVLQLKPPALGTLNGQAFQCAPLRNGDLIGLGATKIQFWLSETKLRDWRWRERLTWTALVLLCLVQIGLIYWLATSSS